MRLAGVLCLTLAVSAAAARAEDGAARFSAPPALGTAPAEPAQPAAPTARAGDDTRSRDSTAVKAALAANPDHDLILCLGGCGAGNGQVLWRRPRIQDGDRGTTADGVARLVPASFTAAHAGSDDENDVQCLAGCADRVGVVLWRGKRFAWISGEPSRSLAESFRAIAQKLLAAEVEDAATSPGRSRAWVATRAGDMLRQSWGLRAAAYARPELMAASRPTHLDSRPGLAAASRPSHLGPRPDLLASTRPALMASRPGLLASIHD